MLARSASHPPISPSPLQFLFSLPIPLAVLACHTEVTDVQKTSFHTIAESLFSSTAADA